MNPPTQVNAMLSSSTRQTAHLRSRPATRLPLICVVDPQAGDYEGWGAMAEANGARFQIVASAAEALRFARINSVDLWVVNVELPGISGCELCEMLKARAPLAPVYLIADAYTVETERAAWQSRASMFGCKGAHAAWLEQWLPGSPSSSRGIRGPG